MKPFKYITLIFSLLFLLSGSDFFTINTSASRTSQPPVYYVRFSGTGLGIYADPSLAGTGHITGFPATTKAPDKISYPELLL